MSRRVAAKFAASRLLGLALDRGRNASDLAAALGGLKGPIMKVAQLMATIPDLLPPEYVEELQKLQSDAPPMGLGFVKRRMMATGAGWQEKFAEFRAPARAAASLGQVHRARSTDGKRLAAKLQYPDMQSAVEADLKQLDWLFAIHRRMDPVIDTSEIAKEIAARVREELDYLREAKHVALYQAMLDGVDLVRVPRCGRSSRPAACSRSTGSTAPSSCLTRTAALKARNRIGQAMFTAWWFPFSRYGVIHGDPHLGNYTVFDEGGAPGGINLLDYGCIASSRRNSSAAWSISTTAS
jgi:predicted unusual protein kinase regulating ubiquinone biosynthesis (AarF/ABC1/UbiB family)